MAVGRGYLMCVALEAALKLREATGMRAEGWSAADFRHGPVTVARGDIPLLAVSAAGPAAADVEELAAELEGAGTPVLRLADRPGRGAALPGRPARAAACAAGRGAGAAAGARAGAPRGIDPDEPPGLQKVTGTS